MKRSLQVPKMTLHRLIHIAALTAAWCAMWQSFSLANLGSGVLISTAVIAAGIGPGGQGKVRIGPLVRLIWLVIVDLVTSTVGVAKEIITAADTTDEAIIAIAIPEEARQHFLLLVVAVTLTPGTAVVDADPDTGALYLHVLHYEQAASVRRHVERLAGLACEALPTSPASTTTASELLTQ